MNVVLILPKYSVSINDPCCFPIGFMTISAVLKQAGHDVKVLNFNLQEYDLEAELAGASAALFTGFEEFREFNQVVAAWCRAHGIHTVLGGALATFAAEEMSQHFDLVVIGEGETTICEVMDDWDEGHSGRLPGTAWRDISGEFHKATTRLTRPNLNRLPFPDYEGFGIDRYNELHGVRYMGVLTSRGCPYACRFCAQTCSFQSRSLTSVFEEIDHYRGTYGVQHIVFNDNTLNLRKDRFLEICKGMKERGLTWSAAIRVDVFDEEMAAAAKAGGCNYFVVGVESFIDVKLAAMDKHITAAQITAALDLLNEHGIAYHGNVLLGLPGETYADIVAELEAMPTGYNVFPVLVQPFIGTEYQSRSINDEEARHLATVFREFSEARGMAMYREAA